MHAPSWVGILIVLGLAFLLFGRPGRISGLMEDLGKGIRGFRKGLDDTQNPPPSQNGEPPRQIRDQSSSSEDTRSRTDDRTGA
jgi:TatA/E family protein of Tat protein translocase